MRTFKRRVHSSATGQEVEEQPATPALKTDSSAKYINHSKTRNESFAVDLWIYPSAADLPAIRCGRKDDRKEGRQDDIQLWMDV